MKKLTTLFLLALLSVNSAWADVKINETNFPDENFRNWVLGQNYGSDSILTEEEIAGVTYISVTYREDIQNLQGMEFFTALEYLYCNNNKLTSLDMSNNTALRYLDCYDNQLTTLDVSKNTKLTNMQCYNNQLTSLNVSGCEELYSLNCNNNQLTTLDVSECTALGVLNCNNNQLTTIDLSKNKALKKYDISGNPLTDVYSGSCGDHITYTLDTGTGVLSITGNGEMDGYSWFSSTYAPWYNLRSYIKTIEISEGVTKIGCQAFYGCYSLTSVSIPNSIKTIGGSAFDGCYSLASITIPNSVKAIEAHAFSDCTGLTSVTIPNSVSEIGQDAGDATGGGDPFEGCSNLKYINITDLEAWCKIDFYYNAGNPLYHTHHLYLNGSDVTDLVIPDGVTSISDNAFDGCSLLSVTIPNSVTSIGNGAFRNCYSLTSATIGSGVTSIGNDAFNSCSKLEEIKIPNSVTSIGNNAFGSCYGLTSIVIPNSVTSIGIDAFLSCTGLTSVNISNNLTTIGQSTFSGCSKLSSIEIPNSVTSIGEKAFYNCPNLISVTIPSSVTSIGVEAFSWCPINNVTCYAENVPQAGNYPFGNITNATLYVPEASLEAYKTTAPWSSFGVIERIETKPVCATPTITFENGKLQFTCETEDVTYVYSFTTSSMIADSNIEETLPETLVVSVYAKKDGYVNSKVSIQEINVSGMGGLRGDVNNDGTVSMPDAMFIVNKILNGKFPDE